MPTTTSLVTARQRLGTDLDLLTALPGNSAIGVSAVGASSITAAYYLANSNRNGTEHQDEIVFRPNVGTPADAIRYLGLNVNTTGVGAIAPTYTDVTISGEAWVEFWKNVGLRPDVEILNALNQALEYIFFHSWEPLSLAADAAMRESGVTSWGTHVNATEAKQTTAFPRTMPGFIRSLAITNTSANGYLPTADIFVSPGEMLLIAALSRTNSGTSAQLVPWDATNSVAFGTTITNALQTWQFQWQIVAAPSTCKKINIRLGGTGASDVTDWQALWVYRVNASTPFVLPGSYLDERFKVESIAYSNFLMSSGSGNFEAQSMRIIEIPRDHYTVDVMPEAATPAFVQFHRPGWFAYPLWIQMRLPESERGSFSTDSTTTGAPLHLLIPQAIIQLLEPPAVRSRIPRGDELYVKALADFKQANRDRKTEGPAMRTTPWRFPSLIA